MIDFFAPNGLAEKIPLAVQERLRLHEIALAANDARSLDDILKMIYAALRDIGQFDRVGIWLKCETGICGSWGTDNHGNILDERGRTYSMAQLSPPLLSLFSENLPYVFYAPPPFPHKYDIAMPEQLLAIALRAEGEILGILFADNLLTERPLTEQSVANVLLICDQAASVIAQARYREQRERSNKRRTKLMELAAAINASLDLTVILRLVRDAVVDSQLCDRAGIFTLDDNFVQGAWGTDEEGKSRDERDYRCLRAEWEDVLTPLLSGKQYWRESLPHDAKSEDNRTTYPCINIGLRTGNRLVGILCVDNRLTGRTIHDEDIATLLDMAEQAAAAIRNARFLEEMRLAKERQERLAKMATAIGAATALNDILRMVRDGIVIAGGFDRAGVFLYDEATHSIHGTWGTDRAGHLEDIHVESHSITPEHTLIIEAMQENTDFVLEESYSQKYNPLPESPMYGVKALGVVAMRAGSEVVGLIGIDNLLTNRPITAKDIESILPFAAQAAAAIQNARMLERLNETKEALIKVERMRAVGELASGVAHNINNVLAAILGYAELIAEMEETPAEVRQYARTIERAANDGAEIVRRLRQFTKKEALPERIVFDLGVAAQEALDLTRPLWRDRSKAHGARIETVTEFAEPLMVLGLPSEIREVLVNVIKNAAEAMPNGGMLIVRGERQEDTAIIQIDDTGTGMSPEVLSRVFDPFFTTRGMELGMGLGLSVAHGIVTQHRGKIEVESELGKGSRFTLKLPLSNDTPMTSSAARSSLPVSLKGVSVLVVEDEEMVAQSIAQTLQRNEITTAFAYDAEDALQWLAKNGAACHIIVSDHGMEGMTGLELLAQVKIEYPHIRRVLLSGWGSTPPDGADMSAAERVLSKPIPAEKLLFVLAQLIG